ncbi:S9 family peptidase [Actinocorallia sp. API 0066]|uniref:S9 family peptidase n=1 Tax=Actinocorallia sp. API 0066 TaxID=2896846 RepID=UPI001E2A6F46|nr:S9 family peptidase [Actinocorallia sp. API 0066]MCD0450459.1 S9 family peptidase [Actinocorallia sp. API 0066]
MAWSPDGSFLVFSADEEGDELHRVYRVGIAPEAEPEVLVASPGRHCVLAVGSPFDPTGGFLVYATNDREPTVQDVAVRDLRSGDVRRVIPEPGSMLVPVGISPDGRRLLVRSGRSDTDISALVIDLADPEAAPLTVSVPGGVVEALGWLDDASGFLFRTDQLAKDQLSLARYSLLTGAWEQIGAPEWDVEHAAAEAGLLVWVENQDGRSVLRGLRGDSVVEFPELPDGHIIRMRIVPGGTAVVLHLDTPTRPAEIVVIDLATRTLRYLTDSRPPRLHVYEPVKAKRVSYPSEGGRRISAQIYVPRGDGPFPVVMWIHGGPRGQERPVYARSGLYQHLVACGVAIVGPDATGSSGYGTAFEKLIYRDWGGPDLEDFAATVEYLKQAPWADESRVAVVGASYGGFAALSCLSRLDHPWAAGVSICGPSNLVTLAAACPPTWRDAVDRILGDPERDAEQLRARSPITHADAIDAPLYVIQGARDPRVPRGESDQIVERLRARGTEVRYDVFPDEGHGFTKRHNELHVYREMGQFLRKHLL